MASLTDILLSARDAALVVQGELPGGIILEDIPAENWRRLQLAQDLRFLALAIEQLSASIDAHARRSSVRLSHFAHVNALNVLVIADLVLEGCANVHYVGRASPSFAVMLNELDREPASRFGDAARRCWPLKQARNQLLVHRDPDQWGYMRIAADGAVILERYHRTQSQTAEAAAAQDVLTRIASRLVKPENDVGYDEVCRAVLRGAASLTQAERDQASDAFKKAGMASLPLPEMLTSAVDLVRVLGVAPPVALPDRAPPLPGTRVHAVAIQQTPSGPKAGMLDGMPVIASFVVAENRARRPGPERNDQDRKATER